MTKESFERAKCILACIESAKNLIELFERVYEAGKGEIVICTKGKLSGEHRNIDAIVISGDVLDTVKNAYIGHYKAWRDEKQREFEVL